MDILEGYVIVITGASGRLGRVLVQRFAEDGASIAAVVRREEDARDLPFPENGDGWAFPVDLTDESLVRACFRQIRDQFGRIDAVVHAVGTWASRPLLETSLDEWNALLQTNLTSTFLCFREAARVMDGPGRLVAFASAQGADRGQAQQAAYSASKAGIIRLVEALDAEFSHVTAHAIAPSTVRYDDEGPGVRAIDLVEIVRSLILSTGDATRGATIRAYGTSG